MCDSTTYKIQQVITDLLDKYRFIFWYDEGGKMQDIADALQSDDIRVIHLEGNPFTVKYRIVNDDQMPSKGYVIYSKETQPKDEDNWLLDFQVEGTVFSADMSSMYAAECGIPLERKTEIVDGHLAFFKTKDNRTKLKERIDNDMTADEIIDQMLAVVCHTEPHYDSLTYALIKELLHGRTAMNANLEAYSLSDVYWNKVEKAFGYHGAHNVKDLLIVLFRNDMERHSKGNTLTNEALIFMRDWRDSRMQSATYREWAEKLQEELGIEQQLEDVPLKELVSIETFPCVDKMIAHSLRQSVLNDSISVDDLESIIGEREQKLFFDTAAHTLYALLESRRLFADIAVKMKALNISSSEEGFAQYWQNLYIIDLDYRHYFREARNAEFPYVLKDITARVEREYTNKYLSELARKWQPIVDGMGKWKIDNVISQRSFFYYNVCPFIEKGNKLFVIISDALRYETMSELADRMAKVPRMKVDMKKPMLSTLPSYTQLGMAALLPHQTLSYERHEDNVFADGHSTKGSDAREKVLKVSVPRSKVIKAEDFLQIAAPKTYFKDYDLIYIYSNKIDKTGDNKDTEKGVFEATDAELDNIEKLIEKVRNGNGSNVLVTSDHGYIYQNEELPENFFSSFKPMGDIISDSRRFVVGRNLIEDNAVNTWNSEDVGLKAGWQIQTAKGINRIPKQGSGSRFVHGGTMLQEITVPVLHVNITKKQGTSEVSVDILNRRSRITTSSQVISFYQNEPVTDKVKGVTLRMGFYDEKGTLVSDEVILTFNSNSDESAGREQRHRFVFKQQLSDLNGQDIYLYISKKINDTKEQWGKPEKFAYRVSVLFQEEF